MNIEKMNRLADLMEALPRENFDMNSWASKDGIHDDKVCFLDLSKHTCKTTCCVAGYQILSNKKLCIEGTGVYEKKNWNYRGWVDELAANQLDLTEEQRIALFHYDNCPRKADYSPKFRETPKGAAQRIRYMIKTGE